MSLREKIIVVLAVLAVLYGAYELGLKNLFAGDDSPAKSTAKEKQDTAESDIGAFTSKIIKQSESVSLTPREQHLLANRDMEWSKNPFIDTDTAIAIAMAATEAETAKRQKETTAEQDRFTYSGYIALGSVKLAVINGMEYEQGEKLKETEYLVQTIQPSSVKLFDGRRHITVQLEEIEAKVK